VQQPEVTSCNFTAPIALLAVRSKGPYGSLTVGLLDIGSGLGGPSRYLAANYGCRVIGIDITEEYYRLALVLAARMGLEGRVEYRHGDARVLLFPDETFDGA
jgi:cyclopropane fatty-acyl-phospholipid synthase-like methyltransferase